MLMEGLIVVEPMTNAHFTSMYLHPLVLNMLAVIIFIHPVGVDN